MKNYILKMFTMVIFLTNLLQAEQTINVRNFDISGIKLGMTEQECIEILTSKYKVDKEQIRHSYGIGNMHNLSSLSLRKDSMGINITFDRLEIKVKRIIFSMANENGNAEAVYKKALEKYGKPTINSSWCNQIIKSDQRITCNEKFPYLTVSSAIVKLKDPQYVINFLNKRRENAIAPSF